jgi:D-xylose transport system substrate-binding protein
MIKGNKKLVFLGLICIVFVFVLFSTGVAAQDTIKIGVSFHDLRNERWSREDKMMSQLCKEIGVEYMSQSANSDAGVQLSQCENMLSQGIDVLIVIPYDAISSASIVETAHQSNVPVIAYDRLIKNTKLDLYVSFDSIRVGEMMTEYVVNKYPKGNYIILKGDVGDNNAHLVYEGQMNILDKYIKNGDIKIVAEQFCKNWSGDEALKHTENALTAVNNDVVAILTGYDGLATGAIQALTAQGLAGKVAVTGQDAELSACQRVVEGTQTMTIYKPLKTLARKAIESAVALAKKEKLTDINGSVKVDDVDINAVLLDPIVVTADNMVDIIVKDGFQSLEDIYKNIPKENWPKI